MGELAEVPGSIPASCAPFSQGWYFGCGKPGARYFQHRKSPCGRARSHSVFLIEDPYRGDILRRELPSGVVQGLGIWRWWVRFPSSRGRLELFFLIFGVSWEVSVSGLGTFLDRFEKVLKKCPTGSENYNFQKWSEVCFLSQGAS